MKAFLLYAQISLSVLPLIPAAIQAAEAIFGPGAGPQKLAFVLNAVTEAINATPSFTGKDAETVVRLVTNMVNATVAMFNASGIFAKA